MSYHGHQRAAVSYRKTLIINMLYESGVFKRSSNKRATIECSKDLLCFYATGELCNDFKRSCSRTYRSLRTDDHR